MGESGTLRLSTTIIAGNEMRDGFSETENRNHVRITVADTGPGMDENIRQHISSHSSQRNQKRKGNGPRAFYRCGIVKSPHGFLTLIRRRPW